MLSSSYLDAIQEEKVSCLGKQIIRFLDTIACQYSSELLTTQSYLSSSATLVMSQEKKSIGNMTTVPNWQVDILTSKQKRAHSQCA